jgi:hypothetical protein
MAGGAGSDACVATDCIRHRMIALSTVAALAVHPRAISCLMAGEAAGGVVGGLHDTGSLVEIFSRLERMAWGKAKLAGCSVPA